jgi:hypothetical protein
VTNTRMLLGVEVPTGPDGSPLMDGPLEIAGVSGSGPAVLTDFSAAVGASLGGRPPPPCNAAAGTRCRPPRDQVGDPPRPGE